MGNYDLLKSRSSNFIDFNEEISQLEIKEKS